MEYTSIYHPLTFQKYKLRSYYRLRLEKDQIRPLSWQNLPNYDCKIFVYSLDRDKQSQRATYQEPILQSYVDIVMNGCLEYGTNFAKQFINTTEGWNQWWLNDRTIPRRPWVTEPNYKIIDKLLTKYVPGKFFHKLPEEFDDTNCECKVHNSKGNS